MFETKKKFLLMFEEVQQRLLDGGFANGDYVTIDFPTLKKSVWYKNVNDNIKELVDALSKSEYNLKIKDILDDDTQPHGWMTGNDVPGEARFMVVGEEIAANLFGREIIVPMFALKIVKLEGNNITPGHPKYKENKPEREENVGASTEPTNSKADNGKRNLPTVNIVIPAGPVRDGKNDAKKPVKK